MRRWQKDKVFGFTFPKEIPNNLAEKRQADIQLTALPLEHVQAREVVDGPPQRYWDRVQQASKPPVRRES